MATNHKKHLPQYVFQRNGLYYFRYTLPADVAQVVCKTELRYSLRTGYVREARRRSARVTAGLETFFNLMRKPSIQELTDGQSTENQLQELRKVADQNNWQVIQEFVDHGVSGAKGRDQRPAFDQMCKAVVRRELDLIMTWSVD